MAPTSTDEEGGDPLLVRRTRPQNPRARSTSPIRSRVAGPEAAPSSPPAERKSTGSSARKRGRAADKSPGEEGDDSDASSRTEKRNTGQQPQEVAAAASASASASSEHSTSASSEHSTSASSEHSTSASSEHLTSSDSPIRWPAYLFDSDASATINIDPAIRAARDATMSRYHKKRKRDLQLPTLAFPKYRSCLVGPELLPVREKATKIVLQAAKTIIGLSSYIDCKLLSRSCGFLINWNEGSRAGTFLTSALLIRTKSPSSYEWLGRDEYAPYAEVHAHMLDKDNTSVVARLLYYDKHFNLALFEIDIDLSFEMPNFSSEVMYSQEVLVLGRDDKQCLNVDHGRVVYEGPGRYKRHHYMFLSCVIQEWAIGGPIIDFNGQVLGIAVDSGTGFVPSSIIHKWLHMWEKFHCVPRLHIGMKFSAIKFLDPAHVETISRKCNIDAGLIVIEVSEGSAAERLGIRNGDVIKCWNGEVISTTVELENLLLHMCDEYLDKGGCVDPHMGILIGVFQTRKGSHSDMKLMAKVSNEVEVVTAGTYPLYPKLHHVI